MTISPRDKEVRVAFRGTAFRIILAASMLALLMHGLAYWWNGNQIHEWLGTIFFICLGKHVIHHRQRLYRMFKGRYGVYRVLIATVHALLIGLMLVLLTSSVAISKTIMSAFPMHGGILLRQVHWFSAYWVMIIVGMHIGLHWHKVIPKLWPPSDFPRLVALRTATLRAGVAVIVTVGILGFSKLTIGTKLSLNYSLEFWSFKISVAPFFLYWGGVVGTPAVLTYYTALAIRQRPSSRLVPND